ncbi:MAG: glycosyltransferase family 4 protein [Bacteroidota bacterium]
MKILYIHQYFRTPEEGGSTRSYELAKSLVEKGHQVIMITTHNQLNEKKSIDGIKVHYLRIPYQNEFGFFKRIYAFLRFVRRAKREAKKLSGIDLAYVMTTPLTTGLIALSLKKKLGIPFYFEVGDLWPEAPIQMGVIKSTWLIKKLYAFEKRCYQEAEMVIALSSAIEAYINKVTPETQTHVITNLANCEYFKPLPTENKIFQIGYFGTFGKANDLGQIIRLATYLQNESIPLHFTLMGEGAEEEQFRLAAKNLKNLKILPFGNKDEVRNKMEKMDAIYISYKNIPILNTGSPNKFFDGLAAGKLIIINFQGWIKALIESEKCGFSHDPENPASFLEKVTPFLDDQALLKSFQKNSRRLAETQFEKKLLTNKLNDILTH